MRGISFNIPNEYGNVLEKILYKFDVKKYNWYISDIDIYNCDDKNDFSSGLISGISFDNSLNSINNQYIVAITLMAFNGEFAPIVNYNDFKKSNCDLVVLISDSVFVEIYCKNKDDIEKLKNNALNFGFTNIEYITKENDKRNVFTVS